MRILGSILLLAGIAAAQTSQFPGLIDTDRTLFVTSDNVQSSLSAAVAVGDTSIPVASATGFAQYMIATVCDVVTNTGKCTAFEHMLVTGISGNTLTVTRGFAGTSARAHAAGRLVSVLIDSAHQQALKSAVLAIETALGPNLINVGTGWALKSSIYDFAAQTCNASNVCTAGGSNGAVLINGVSATITMTPCPLGFAVGGSLYLSGGVGTAEAVTITGGTCTSGATSGTVTFTPAQGHAGAFTVKSATSGIQEALNSLPATGGMVYVPPDAPNPLPIYTTVKIGNGSAGGASTTNGVTLIGQGSGASSSETTTPSAATRLIWRGPAGGTMVQINGPFSRARIAGLFFDCNHASNPAAQGLVSNHAFNSFFEDLEFDGCSGYAIGNYAYPNPTGVVIGANNNIWDNISIYADGISTASGIQVGAASDPYPSGSHLDVAKNQFRNLNIGAGTAGTAVELRFVDSSSFMNFNVTSGATGIKVTPVVSNTFYFPQAMACYTCNLFATTTLDDSAWAGSVVGMMFMPYNNDSDLLPNPVGTNGWSAGFSTNLQTWGKWRWNTTLYNGVTSSSAIANTTTETAFSKSYTLPANITGQRGLIVRVRAGGRYSTTGTPSLTIYIRVQGSGTDGYVLAGSVVTAANNASNYAWSASGELTVRSTGLGGAAQIGPSIFAIGGTSASTSTFGGSINWPTVVNIPIYVTATWGTASASNSIILDTLQVELVNPGVSN